MKTPSNSSKKAEKQTVEIKTGMKIISWLTRNGLWPVFTEAKLQIDPKTISKNGKAQKSKQNIFESHNRHKFLTKNNWISCNYSEGQLGLLLMRLSHETTNQKTGLYT